MKTSFLLLVLILKVATGDVLERYLIDNFMLTCKLLREHSNAANGNFLFSPILTQSVLALAAIGAGEETAEEIIKAAYLPNGLSAIIEMYSHLQKYLSSISSISIYNEILADISKLNSLYIYLTKTAFNAVITTDGIKQTEKSTLSVNILELSHRGGISSHLKLKTPWRHTFYRNRDVMPFFDEDGTKYNIEMIRATTPAILSEDTAGKAYFIEFHFVDDNLSFTLVIPKRKEDFRELKEVFPKLLYNQTKREVLIDIILPQFGMSYYSPLTSMLKSLGINLAFSEKADFLDFRQHIDDGIEHTAFNLNKIPVDQTFMGPNFRTIYFPINQPFIYFLRHKVLGFLMIGRFLKPTETEVVEDLDEDDIEFNITWPEQMYIF